MLAVSAFAQISTAAATVQVRYDQVYDTVGGVSLKMDLYLPPDNGTPRPLVLAIHGGCFTGGSKTDLGYIGKDLANQGFIVASVNYRLAPAHVFPAAIQDVRAALRYLRKNAAKYNIDTKRIASYGQSAGSSLAAVLGTQPIFDRAWQQDQYSGHVNLVVDMYGRMDFLHEQHPNDPQAIDCAEKYIGAKREANPEQFRRASVVQNANRYAANFIIAHGLADRAVPPVHAQRMHQRLLELGRRSTLILQEGVGHTAPWATHQLVRSLMKREFGMPYRITEASASVVRIDSGNNSPATLPAGFMIDQYYSGGSAIAYDSLTYPVADPLAKTVRYSGSSFGYQFSNSASGFKKIGMTFVEPYAVAENHRMQDVAINGFTAFANHDIVKFAKKSQTAIRHEIFLSTTAPVLNLQFTRKAIGNAAVGAIDITPIDSVD